MPDAHDAQRPLCGLPPLCTGEVGQYGARPLQYAAGVAACCRGDPYAVRRAPRRVDVVEPDGGRGDQTDARTGEQAPVATGAGAVWTGSAYWFVILNFISKREEGWEAGLFLLRNGNYCGGK